MEEKKGNKVKRFFKFIFNNSLVRGVIKSLPFGNVVYEVGENISTEIKNKNGESEIKNVMDKKPHNWFSISVQLLCLGAIVYAFISKQITIDQVLDLLKSFTIQ